MNKTRFALTSALVLLGFGLMAGDCDCKTMAPKKPGQAGAALELPLPPAG
ncbi:MAG: hypothetical protein JRG85_14410 [Deltaproteobacteria bacterium]|nr:hypothetical protein [Deltaproteobacteria bacterium]